jgi:hypothetical protein
MPANIKLFSRISHRKLDVNQRTRQSPLSIISLIVGLALLTACTTGVSSSASASSGTMAPAHALATGTLGLEGTNLAIDAEAAAKLLPLWQLLDELETNSAASTEEIAAVVEEIQSTMSAEQVKAIDAMSINEGELAASQAGGSSASASVASQANAAAQVTSAGTGPMMGGDMLAGGAPPSGAGPLPGGNSQQRTTAVGTSGTSSTPTLIEQVIKLLERKLQS